MKKVMCIALACVLVCVGLCGCGNSVDPVGDYKSAEFSYMFARIMNISDAGKSEDPASLDLVVTKDGGDYAFEEPYFTGSAKLEGGMLVCTREEGADDGYTKEIGDYYAETVSYFVHEGYLVNEETEVKLYEGDLPDGETATGIVMIGDDYGIAFNENGRCMVNGYDHGDDKFSSSGTYTVDGSLVHVTLTEYTAPDGKTVTGEYSFSLFVKDGTMYNDVYRKIQ